ncbi:hypothetical protein SAMN02800687_0817 [Curtobacterium sp. UNCCL20]|nr:hypothetical protein SAMN02800687_0817 [Curtobacterium sp. UNCCL20]
MQVWPNRNAPGFGRGRFWFSEAAVGRVSALAAGFAYAWARLDASSARFRPRRNTPDAQPLLTPPWQCSASPLPARRRRRPTRAAPPPVRPASRRRPAGGLLAGIHVGQQPDVKRHDEEPRANPRGSSCSCPGQNPPLRFPLERRFVICVLEAIPCTTYGSRTAPAKRSPVSSPCPSIRPLSSIPTGAARPITR